MRGWVKSIRLLAIGLGLAGLLAGCAAVSPARVASITPSTTAAPIAYATPGTLPSPVVPRFPLPTNPPGTTPPSASVTAPPTLPYRLEFAVCTPLEDHPLDQLRLIVSDPYRPPKGKSDARHHGVDFSYYRFGERDSIQGVGVQAVLPGQVAAALVDSYPFGNLVIVETAVALLPADLGEQLGAKPGESLFLLYAHLDAAPLLRIGESVPACQPLGAVGKSGNAVEPHLHLEARLGPAGTVFNELGEYFAGATETERSNYRLWRTSGVYRHLDPMLLINYALDN